MTGYDAYKMYVALKNHFNSSTYDYFKYNGKTRASVGAYEKRNDKHFFEILAKHKQCQLFIIANIVEDNPNVWVSQLANEQQAEDNFRQWKKRIESLTYTFTNDLNRLHDTYDDNLIVVEGQHPHLLKLVVQKQIAIETLVILNDLCGFYKYWSRNIIDTVVWPQIKILTKKYRPFVPFDPKKFKKIVVDHFKKE
jgi:hypothetical protein